MPDLIARKNTRYAGTKYLAGDRIPDVKPRDARLLVGAKIAAYAPEPAPAVASPIPVQAVATVEHTTAAAEPNEGYAHRAVTPEAPRAPAKKVATKRATKRATRKKADD